MRAENTLQYMADFYPELFPTRKHCLDYLFCTVGNGYEWINGELAHKGEYEKKYKLKKTIEKAEFKFEQDWLRMNKFYKELYEKGSKKIPYEYDFEWYPLSKEYSALYNYPDDIKPDGKLLLEECKQMLIKDGIEV